MAPELHTVAGVPMEVRRLTPEDRCELIGLHASVFGAGADEAWHAWKYHTGGGLGSGVWANGELIAHCGGVPRSVWCGGHRVDGLQIGDVMVAPAWRGVLTRRGPFYWASKHFYQSQVGKQRPFGLGFGFPSARHLRLAEAVGLLGDGGAVLGLDWDLLAAPPKQVPRWQWQLQPLNWHAKGLGGVLDGVWAQQKACSGHLTLGDRDSTYLMWRFGSRPKRMPLLAGLRRPWSRTYAGLVVVDCLPSGLAHWLDWIGPPAMAGVGCRAAQLLSTKHGAKRMQAWATGAVVQELAGTGMQQPMEVVRLGVVAGSVTPQVANPCHLNWWLMGGDTDFL